MSFMSKNRPLPDRIPENTRVCSGHFDDSCFENLLAKQQGFAKKLFLKANAVPTIHPEDMPSTSQQVVQPVSSCFVLSVARISTVHCANFYSLSYILGIVYQPICALNFTVYVRLSGAVK